ncbi:MAG TPA: carbamoyltransferase N-terminal domain-containing protein, partial [Pyrinomonadaceae bacterium]
MIILGINAYHGDAAAAIIKDGKLIAAVEEERFNRFKHCAGFPIESIKYCLLTAGVTIEDVDHVGISRDPSAHLHKKVLFAATRAAKQAVGGRRQEAVGTIDDGDVGGASVNGGNASNGNGAGIFSQIKDRLGNAAKVRDLRDELARQLNIPKSNIRAQFHNVEHHRAHLA